MSLKTIKHDSTDENFRRDAASLIDSARKEVLVIVGEIRAYGFPDLKWAVERARKKGVSFRIYAANPPPAGGQRTAREGDSGVQGIRDEGSLFDC